MGGGSKCPPNPPTPSYGPVQGANKIITCQAFPSLRVDIGKRQSHTSTNILMQRLIRLRNSIRNLSARAVPPNRLFNSCDVTVAAYTLLVPVLLIVMHGPCAAAASQPAGCCRPTCTHFLEKCHSFRNDDPNRHKTQHLSCTLSACVCVQNFAIVRCGV